MLAHLIDPTVTRRIPLTLKTVAIWNSNAKICLPSDGNSSRNVFFGGTGFAIPDFNIVALETETVTALSSEAHEGGVADDSSGLQWQLESTCVNNPLSHRQIKCT